MMIDRNNGKCDWDQFCPKGGKPLAYTFQDGNERNIARKIISKIPPEAKCRTYYYKGLCTTKASKSNLRKAVSSIKTN